jgi:hypothetical protein
LEEVGFLMTAFPVFQGNCPRNVARDAKYTVRTWQNGNPVVVLVYRSQDNERFYMTNEEHPELIDKVNKVKLFLGLPPNGLFYINEYKQVLVPCADGANYYLAGTYEKPLRFEFEGKIFSGEPVDSGGQPLRPGDKWIGPHPGIPYILSAGGKDIYYTFQPRQNVEKDMSLSDAIGKEAAWSVAQRIAAVKGLQGGRFYVNEFCSIFTPIQEGFDTNYYYIGQLDLSKWFPAPHQQIGE